MFRFTFHIVTALWAASFLFGCSEPGPVACPELLQPGRDMMLDVRAGIWIKGASVCESCVAKADGTVETIERTKTPYVSQRWMGWELPLEISSVPDGDLLKVAMTARLLDGEYVYISTDESGKQQETKEKNDNADSEKNQQWRGVTFYATVNSDNVMTSSDITGETWEKTRKDIDELPEKLPLSLRKAMIYSQFAPGVYSALADVLAYWPKAEEIRLGQRWSVRREFVFPYWSFDYVMMCSALFTRETSECRVVNVQRRWDGVVATVCITGRRTPTPYVGVYVPSSRMSHMDLLGEMRINLTTGAIEDLHLTSRPSFISQEDREMMSDVAFMQTLSLKPR